MLDPIGRQDVIDNHRLKYTTVLPSYTGEQGENIIYYDGTNYWLYSYIDGAWRINKYNAVDSIVAGSGISVSGATGDVTVTAKSGLVGVNTTQTTITNTTTETNLWSMTVSANTLGTSGAITGKGGFSLNNSTAGTSQPTFKLYYGSGSISWAPTIQNDGNFGWMYDLYIVADGATNAQRAFLFLVRGKDAMSNVNQVNILGGDGGTLSADSTASQTLKLTITWPIASANLSCTSNSVIVMKMV
jgi:hypothetical protein